MKKLMLIFSVLAMAMTAAAGSMVCEETPQQQPTPGQDETPRGRGFGDPAEWKQILEQHRDDDTETVFFYHSTGEKQYLKVRKYLVIIYAESEAAVMELTKQPALRAGTYGLYTNFVISAIDPDETDLDDIMQMPGVVDVIWGLEYDDGALQFVTGMFYVEFKDGTVPEDALEELDLLNNVVSMELSNKYHNGWRIALDVKLSDNLTVCRTVYESGLFVAAEPSFTLLIPYKWL
jgi:hypothetical protein